MAADLVVEAEVIAAEAADAAEAVAEIGEIAAAIGAGAGVKHAV